MELELFSKNQTAPLIAIISNILRGGRRGWRRGWRGWEWRRIKTGILVRFTSPFPWKSCQLIYIFDCMLSSIYHIIIEQHWILHFPWIVITGLQISCKNSERKIVGSQQLTSLQVLNERSAFVCGVLFAVICSSSFLDRHCNHGAQSRLLTDDNPSL